MADIDIEKLENEADNIDIVDERVLDDDEKAKRRNNRQQLKVRHAIEKHLENRKFKKELDYFYQDDDL